MKHLPLLVRQSAALGAVLAAALVVWGAAVRGRESPEERLARQLGPLVQLAHGPAPSVAVRRPDGGETSLADLRGHAVFVNFWATWCPPCRSEIPDLERLVESMGAAPFRILAVSQDDSLEAVQSFFKAKGTGMLVGLDTGGAATRYGTEKLPETYVVDGAGELRLRFVNVQPWTDDRIRAYLQGLASGQ